MNRELMLLTADRVEAEQYEHYRQDIWGTALIQVPLGEMVPICKTAGCVAGNGLLATGLYGLFNEPNRGYVFEDKATRTEVSDVGAIAQGFLDLDEDTAEILFDEGWQPRPDLTVAEALRMLSDGASIHEVSPTHRASVEDEALQMWMEAYYIDLLDEVDMEKYNAGYVGEFQSRSDAAEELFGHLLPEEIPSMAVDWDIVADQKIDDGMSWCRDRENFFSLQPDDSRNSYVYRYQLDEV